MQSENRPMLIAQFLGVKLLNNRGNFPREQRKEVRDCRLKIG